MNIIILVILIVQMNCLEKYNKLIQIYNKCVDDCTKDGTYKYNYKNICYKECPEGTIVDNTNYMCLEFNIKTSYVIKDERDEMINKYRDELIKEFNYNDSNRDFIKIERDLIIQMTSTDNQKITRNRNISTINLSDCEEVLKDAYNISKSLPLIIFKIDYFSPNSLIDKELYPIIGYEIYHPLTKVPLNLIHCKDIFIKLNIPVNIDESKLYKYDPNSQFYTDNCFTYTSENGIDMVLSDRKQEYENNNFSLCEGNCNYTGYDKVLKQSLCDCKVKNKLDLIPEISLF